MANQPTKYKKFVATAATATLVASAIVPVASAASFTDVNPETNSHAAAIDALVEQGIIQGYQDGTFKPNATLTRGHVVKMLGKWVEAQGFEVPADWNTVARFSDLAVDNKDQELVKYAAVVKDAGVFNGNNGVLNAAGSITRENMALTLDRAYAAVFGQSLVEEAAGLVDLTVSDLASAKEEAREAIQALRNLEVSNVNTFMPKDAVTRAQFASFLYRTINVSGETTTPPTGEVAIASLKATKVNELTVEFNQAVDTNAAAFAVKKGTTEDIKVSKVEWNEAGTVATVTVDHKFVAATYNLTVTGLSETALTASVTTTQEVVTEIKFNSDKLVLTGKEHDTQKDLREARITFEVYNQYGEIITDKIPTSYYDRLKLRGIKNSDDLIDFSSATKGLIIAWVEKEEDEGETGTISFTYEYNDVDIDVDHDVVLSEDIEPGSVKVVGVYNENDRAFTTDNVEKYAKHANSDKGIADGEDFYVLLEVKDQFGNPIDAKESRNIKTYSKSTSDTGQIIFNNVRDGIRLSVSNDDIFDLDEDDLSVQNIDGKYYFAVAMEFDLETEGYVKASGENTVTVRSKSTGDVSEGKITLEESSKVYSIGLSAPEQVIAADEKVHLPVTVLDQNGNLITDVAKLNRELDNDNIQFDGDFKKAKEETYIEPVFISKDGAVFLEFRSADNKDDKKIVEMDIEVEIDETRQESSITLKVQPKAYATTLVKLADNFSTTLYENQEFKLEPKHFIIEDQYGRVIDDVSSLDFVIEARKTSLEATGVDFVADKKKYLTFGSTSELGVTTSDTILLNSNNKGSSVLEFELKEYNNGKGTDKKLVTSTLSVTFRTLDQVNQTFESYKIKGDTFGYAVFASQDTTGITQDELEVKVVGITSAGKEVELSGDAYQILSKDYLKPAVGTGKKRFIPINVEKAQEKLDKDGGSSFKTAYQVMINRTGEVLTKEVTISDEDRKYVSLSLKDESSVAGAQLTEVNDFKAGTTISAKSVFEYIVSSKASVEVDDQYGFTYEETDTVKTIADLLDKDEFKYTISNINAKRDDYRIVGNGTQSAQISLDSLGLVDSFDLTVKIGDAIKTVKVKVK